MSALLAAGFVLLCGAFGFVPTFLSPQWWLLILGAAMVSFAIGQLLAKRGKK